IRIILPCGEIFFFQAEDGIRDFHVTGVQTCALPIFFPIVVDQTEIDHYWEELTDGGEEGPCGWLKDRFGLSWQVVPKVLLDMVMSQDHAASQRVTKAFLQMKKFDIEALKRAYDGEIAGAK